MAVDAVAIRPVAVADAERMARLYATQRDFLEPFDPVRPADFFTVPGQQLRLRESVAQERAGISHRFVILVGDEIVGTVSLSNVVRGAMDGCNMGYFVAREHNGRGVATRAVGLMLDQAFGRLGLHRVEAGTLLDNVGSQRVLVRNGFRPLGVARGYLRINGAWQDHVLFERTADGRGAGETVDDLLSALHGLRPQLEPE